MKNRTDKRRASMGTFFLYNVKYKFEEKRMVMPMR